MIKIKKVQTIDGRRIDYFIESQEHREIDAKDLTLFPALIDPHVHFRVPGAEHKENWETGSLAAIYGGVTTVFDMPNNAPPTLNYDSLRKKREMIEAQLAKAKIPLRYRLFLGADSRYLEEIPKVKEEVSGLKIYMGESTGGLVMAEPEALDRAFCICAEHDVLIAVHAEDESVMQANKQKYAARKDPAVHSMIRNKESAVRAISLAIELAKKHKARLYVVHVSSKEELECIRQAKKEGINLYAEAAPHHLFLDDTLYEQLGTKGFVNPPLRTRGDCEALWEGIHDGTIDTIGTDHAPHTIEEKMRPIGSAPSGFPSIELYFPLLLNAYHEKKISLEKIVSLTHTRPQEIFRLSLNEDVVLVDLLKSKKVEDGTLKTRAKWSPYEGLTLQGWPRYTILAGKVYDLGV